jgi:hypothetical protein
MYAYMIILLFNFCALLNAGNKKSKPDHSKEQKSLMAEHEKQCSYEQLEEIIGQVSDFIERGQKAGSHGTWLESAHEYQEHMIEYKDKIKEAYKHKRMDSWYQRQKRRIINNWHRELYYRAQMHVERAEQK